MNNTFLQGTPLIIAWHFNKPDGAVFNLDGYELKLQYSAGHRYSDATGINVVGNTVSWAFPADKQKVSGEHNLKLYIFQNGKLFCKFIYDRAFTLYRGGSSSSPTSVASGEEQVVDLFTTAEFYLFQPIIPAVGNDGYWYVNGEHVLDSQGRWISAGHTVRFDEDTQHIIIDEGRTDENGDSIEQVITDVATALARWDDSYQTAESDRNESYAEAEAERNRLSSAAVSRANKAANDANAAAGSANGAAVDANAAAESANGAAAAANEAAEGADEAKNAANEASEAANEAAGAANSAAERANTAAAAAEHQVDVKRGYGIESVTQPVASQEPGGRNVVRVTTEDGRTFDFDIYNGRDSHGLYATSEDLIDALPAPVVGDYAFVGASFPAALYVCLEDGIWSNSGSTYGGPTGLEIVDNLTAGGSTKALSAEQGKVLDGKVSQLGQKVDDFEHSVPKFKNNYSANRYDNSTGTLSGLIMVGCVAYLDGLTGKICISSDSNQAIVGYVTNLKYYFRDGTTSVVTETPTRKFSAGNRRSGLIYTLPDNVVKATFDYKALISGGGIAMHNVMVTEGDVVPLSFTSYSNYFEFADPINLNREVYVSPSAPNGGDGSFENPFNNISDALNTKCDVVLRGGLYELSSLSFGKCGPIVNIKTYLKERVLIFAGFKLATSDGEIVSGYTKVRSITTTKTDMRYKYIYQFGVNDVSTEIPREERTAIHGRRTYRCDCTAIRAVNSIQEVEDASYYAFYFDTSTQTIYYSRPDAVTTEKFLWCSNSSLFFSGMENKELHLSGISLYGSTFNVVNTQNSVIYDCSVFGSSHGAGFSLDLSRNLKLISCEAARIETFAAGTGDGFNAHSKEDSVPNIKKTSYTLENCWAHDNWNDGYSDHEGCEGFINGGLFEHNCIGGAGAGLTPSYGAHDIIKNAICQSNGLNGVFYVSDGTGVTYETGTFGTITAHNVLSRFNNNNGFACASGNDVTDFINCVAYGNGNYGFGGGGTFRCVNCKSVDNLGGQYATNVTNIGSE